MGLFDLFLSDEVIIEVTCFTHTGNVRPHNEDNYVFFDDYMPQEHQSLKNIEDVELDEEDNFAVGIFDGMGGETNGQMASYLAAKYTTDHIDNLMPFNEERIKQLLHDINMHVFNEKNKAKITARVGTTASMAFKQDDTFYFANVGDSPIYYLRNHELRRLSHPHTNAAYLKARGITERKPALTEYIGIGDQEFYISPYVTSLDYEIGDLYLLCSDGLTDMVDINDIAKILDDNKHLPDTTGKLVRKALEHGGEDNITVILIEIK